MKSASRQPSIRLPGNSDVGSVSVVLFIPSVDKYEQAIDQEHWVRVSLQFFGRSFGGATALGPAQGVWYESPDASPVMDCPYMLICYAKRAEMTDAFIGSMVSFLKSMGRDANQGEVGIVIDNNYWGLRDYGSEPSSGG